MCGVVVEGSNSVWCGCGEVKQCVVWLCEGSNSVWCGCVRGQTVCGVVV